MIDTIQIKLINEKIRKCINTNNLNILIEVLKTEPLDLNKLIKENHKGDMYNG